MIKKQSTKNSQLKKVSTNLAKDRKQLLAIIKKIILSSRRNSSAEWMERLPKKCIQIESILFSAASSFEEHMNTSTLRRRLTILTRSLTHANRYNGLNRSMKDMKIQPLNCN